MPFPAISVQNHAFPERREHMYDKNSNYAINKRTSDASVYKTADDQTILLRKEDFDSEAEFLQWKAWSDENYHAEEKLEHLHSDHLCQLDCISGEISESELPEIIMEHRIARAAKQKLDAETIIKIRGVLTEKQFGRLWKYYVEGRTQKEIAESESVTQGRISESIALALKKIFRLLPFRQISDR